MTSYLSNQMWLSNKDVDVLERTRIKEELTVYSRPFKGEPKRIELFEETNTHLGVPRRWAMQATDLIEKYDDRTVFPSMKWPALEFPPGGGYRSGQLESVQSISQAFLTDEKYGALLEAPCGAGKTLMGLDVASQLGTPVLIIVHKEDLARQWTTTATGGMDGTPGLFPAAVGGHVQQKELRFEGCHFVTAMAQTLYRQQTTLPREFLEYFGLVIYDEGHRYPAETFERVLRLMPSRYRLGMSATWRRSDKLEFIWNWHVGGVEHRTKMQRLGGTYVQVPWNTTLSIASFYFGGTLATAKLISAIAENVPFNTWLAGELIKGADAGRKVLLVSDRISQLEAIRTRITAVADKPITIGLYVGASSAGSLEAAKTCQVMLATYGMMAEGTDVPALDTLFFGTPRADVEQVCGRIQRASHGKRDLLIVDPVFSLSHCKQLANKRTTIYHKLGFKEKSK